jgi:hypothetical protein
MIRRVTLERLHGSTGNRGKQQGKAMGVATMAATTKGRKLMPQRQRLQRREEREREYENECAYPNPN